MRKLPKPTAVIFDWDHTLTNPDPTIHFSLKETYAAMAARGYPLKAGEDSASKPDYYLTDTLRFLSEAYTAEYGEAAAEEALKTYLAIFREATPHHTKFMPGALRTMQYLEKAGIPFAVVSKKYHETLLFEHGHLTKDCFSDACVLGRRPDSPLKPDPGSITEALDILNISQDQRGDGKIWMVGDTFDVDVAVGKAFGCTTFWYGRGDPEILAQHPDIIHVQNHSEFMKSLRHSVGQDIPLF